MHAGSERTLLTLLLSLSIFLAPIMASAGPQVHVVWLDPPTSHRSAEALDALSARLSERFGDDLVLLRAEILRAPHYELAATLQGDGAPSARGLPVVAVGQRVFRGPDEVLAGLERAVAEAATRGGAPWPEATRRITVDALSDTAAAPVTDVVRCDEGGTCRLAPPIWAAYVYQVGCGNCARASEVLEASRARHPRLLIEAMNVYDQAPTARWLAEQSACDELTTPSLFIGGDALHGLEIDADRVDGLLRRYDSDGAPRTWLAADPTVTEDALVHRFEAMGPIAVVVAGLIDGINPCAFATMIFLVSYLAVARRKGRQILTVGAAFTLGVFLAYLAVGLGLHQVLDLLRETLATLGRWLMGLTAVACLVLGVVSLADYRKARQGRLEDMSLNLPQGLRKRVNAAIRRGRNARFLVGVSFVTGIVVSLLELACTGQVYLPTIIFVTTVPELRAQAITYLVLYNVMFVIPLIVVFVLAWAGTSSRQLTTFLEARAAAVKLGLAALFFGMAAWLLISLW